VTLKRDFRQARWDEPLINEMPRSTVRIDDEISNLLPKNLIRESLNLPDVSEPSIVKHYIKLSHMNYSVDLGPYPLGSCTMKYNPKLLESIVLDDRFVYLHPYMPEEHVQGILKILYELQKIFCEITGMDYCSLQPAAGAQGEFTGALMIKKYHEIHGNSHKDEIIVPDSAHGTNPASAKMAGFKVIEVPSNQNGTLDIDALKSVVNEKTAGLMITNPNTLGIFESEIDKISEIIHSVSGLMYYDGANLNAIMGIARPGDMGFDIVHLNLHKTFGTPHGGGGPGAGPVCVKKHLRDFLPIPIVEFNGNKYYFEYNLKYSIGKVHSFYGNIGVLIKSYIYILRLGSEGLKESARISVLNSNYLLKKLISLPGVTLPYGDKPRKHEFVISLKRLAKDTGVSALDVAKRLLDYGLHAPTIYFPLIVEEAMMIEPTESLGKQELDEYYEVFKEIIETAYSIPEKVKGAPYNTSVRRIKEADASRPKSMKPTYRWIIAKSKSREP